MPAQTLRGGPPVVIAHRGSSRIEPEHTLGAYKRAIRDGADGVECDVRLTADRHLVCVHDRRVDRTSDGAGVVSALELAALEGLDWGSWKASHLDEDEMPLQHKAQILTLRQLIRTVQRAERQLDLVIETKHPTRYSGDVERALVALLAEFELLRPGRINVRLMSFSSMAVQRMARLAPHLERVQLTELPTALRFMDALPPNVHMVGTRIAVVRRIPAFVKRQHNYGHQVHVWTVDELEDVHLCLELGVDAIITNRPAMVREAVDAAWSTGVLQ
ncbi:glycerophosphodiester phosphodiesterase family protein [Allobranchiibius sp. GilTou38]|uniref:glycerophosphodiester phosphodiesterase family protein n=1 Tax=Allobranchiibius sp. GilTou38 TaxID=2815210 RepID=UPI001AA18CBB|nr:glycerophosphodiester phosphodiesterase family protein [Allobranchiibius sp. GilTou38]MBO1765493.1 glycerophosphodiester phosphodiesterase [Allobranchiibius sp. GilTou38]